MPRMYRGRCLSCLYEVSRAEGWLGVRLDSGEVAVLPHPLERERLAEYGFTLETARRENRLMSYVTMVCDGCTAIVDLEGGDPRLGPLLRDGCARAILEILPLVNCRLRKRTVLSDIACTRCCAGRLYPLSNLQKTVMACPACGEVSFQFEWRGIS